MFTTTLVLRRAVVGGGDVDSAAKLSMPANAMQIVAALAAANARNAV